MIKLLLLKTLRAIIIDSHEAALLLCTCKMFCKTKFPGEELLAEGTLETLDFLMNRLYVLVEVPSSAQLLITIGADET